ncbi:hypothetical protein E1B28_006839 [Marasmius oreades]|uniref:Uncharacterized protein n=1 Tax=Marasmius oreades TaxID=181124 RepID=A0A9P7UWX3_9AGAR|nr:uncharacterized protein E1B28_006839 [Marasmius oreades]KAG7096166.1 hypothetical protein E1B28_006839 [Marasmius oreades]
MGLDRLPPHGTPLDWFTPRAFNDLPLSTHALYSFKPTIALPPTGVASPTRIYQSVAFRKMTKENFMAKYGNKVLKAYDVVSKEDVLRICCSTDDDEDPDAAALS